MALGRWDANVEKNGARARWLLAWNPLSAVMGGVVLGRWNVQIQ